MVQYDNQNVNIDKIQGFYTFPHFYFYSFLLVCVLTSVQFYHKCGFVYTNSLLIEQFCLCKDPLGGPFVTPSTLLLQTAFPSLISGNH